MIRRVIARANIEDLEGKIQHAIVRKNHIQNHLNELKKRHQEKHLSLHQLNHELEKEIDGRTLEEWIKHYDYYISYCRLLIRKKEREIRNSKILVVGLSILFILALSLFAIRSGPSFVGFSVQDTDSGDSASEDSGSSDSGGGDSGDSSDAGPSEDSSESSSSEENTDIPTEETPTEESIVEEETSEEPSAEEDLSSGSGQDVETTPEEEILEENNETIVMEDTEQETETPSSGGGSSGGSIISNESQTQELNETVTPDFELNETAGSFNQTNINETLLNETIVEEILVGETNITTIQYGAILGKPVKWKKTITLEEAGPVTITIPENAENISVTKIEEKEEDDSNEESLEEKSLAGETDEEKENETKEGLEENNEKIVEEENQEKKFGKSEEKINLPDAVLEKTEAEFSITGKVVVGGSSLTASDSKIIRWIKNFFSKLSSSFTGRVIQNVENEIIEELEIEILDNATEYEVEYETSAPYAIETENDKGKTVKIVGPEEVHYQNVLSFTELSNDLKITTPLGIRIYWEENNTYIPTTFVEDLDSDGFYDYVEWITPHLSNQTFNIIVITKAIQLDANKTFIRDIYGYVNSKDDNWTYIPNNEWVRVTFEIPLDETRDITLYARSNASNSTVEVYYFNTSDNSSKILTFPPIENESYYKVYLTGLNGTHDTFDLKVLGGIEIDLIIDPILDPVTGWINKSFSSVGNQNDRAEDVVVDSNDYIYTVGYGYNLTGTGSNDDWWMKKFYKNGTEFSTSDGWNKTFDFFNESDRAYGVAVDSNNDVYVVGYVSNSTGNLSDQHIRAYYPNGTEKWNKTIDYANLDDVFWSVAADQSSDIYAVGYGTDAVAGGSSRDITVRKYYPNGTEWGGNFPLIHNGAAADEEARDIAIDSDNNFTVAGYAFAQIDPADPDWFFGRFDSLGNAIFTPVSTCGNLGGGGIYDCYRPTVGETNIVNATKHDPNDDTFYLAGGTAQGATNRYLAMVYKFYPNRTRVGTLTFSTNVLTGNSWFNEIYVDSNSNVYLVGAWENSTEWRVYYLNSTLGRVNNITDRAYSSTTLAAANGIWFDSLQDMYVAGFGYDITPTWGSSSGEDWLIRKFEANYTESDFVVRFIDSTKTNNSVSNLTYIIANFTMSHRYVDNIIYNFNGTNYTLFNESLVLGYNFDNGTNFLDEGGVSRKIYDISIYKNNGTQNASFDPYVSGKYGTAFNTTGGTTYFNSSNNNQALNMTGKNVTISVWLKHDLMNGNNGVVVTRGNGSYMLGIFNSSTDGGCQTGDIFFSAANSTVLMNCSTTSLSQGTWAHVVAVQEGPLNSKIYINGVDVTGSGMSGTPEPLIHHDQSPTGVIIGGGQTPTGYGVTRPFFGSIDELFIWDRPLSAAEVRQLYQTNLKKTTESDFVVTINQTLDNSGNSLSSGNYTFYGWAEYNITNVSLTGGNWTGIYWLNLNPDLQGPLMSFVSPTYDNLTAISQGWFPVNVSINKDSLDRLYYQFNGTNYTLLDENLMILYNFDNRSTLGEDLDNFTNVLTFVPGTYREWNASCTNCPTLTTSGLYGNAYTFDGTNDVIKIHNDTAMFSTGWTQGTNWTIKGAFKSNYSHDGVILSWNSTGSPDHFVLRVTSSGELRLNANMGGAGGCLVQAAISGGAISIFDNNWHDFVVYYNPFSNEVGMVLDGSSPGGAGAIPCNSGETFSIPDGWEIGGDSQVTGSYFNGSIDELYIYNRTVVGTVLNLERTAITRYQLTKLDSSNWTFYINQTFEGHKQDNSDWPLKYGNWTYEVFARGKNNGVWNTTSNRVIRSNPRCGETFSISGQEIGLVADMNCGDVETVSLGASNTTLDCNGYTLNSSINGPSVVPFTSNGNTGWTIENCNFNLGSNSTVGFTVGAYPDGKLNNSNFTGGIAFNTTGNFSWYGYSKLNNTAMSIWQDGFVWLNVSILKLEFNPNATLHTWGAGFKLNSTDVLNLTGGTLNVTTYDVADAGFTLNYSSASIKVNNLLVHTHGPGAAIEGQTGGGSIDGGQFKGGIAVKTSGSSLGGENLIWVHQNTPLEYIRLEDTLINLTGGSYLSLPAVITTFNQTGSRIHFYGSRPIFPIAGGEIDFGGIEITNFNNSIQPIDLSLSTEVNLSNIRNLNGSGPGLNNFVDGSRYKLSNITFNTSSVTDLRVNSLDILNLKDVIINGIYNFSSIGELTLNSSLYGSLTGSSININGTNLSAAFRIENNSIYANSTLTPGFNKSWNLTLLGLNAWSISNREIHKDGVLCSDCYNSTALDAAVVKFNVTGFSKFNISGGSDPYALTTCANITSSGNYTLQNNVTTTGSCFNITANNVVLDGQGYFVVGDSNDRFDTGVWVHNANYSLIKNLNISGFGQSIRALRSNNGTFENLNISAIGDFNLDYTIIYGILLENGRNNTLRNLNITLNETDRGDTEGYAEGVSIANENDDLLENINLINISGNYYSEPHRETGITFNGNNTRFNNIYLTYSLFSNVAPSEEGGVFYLAGQNNTLTNITSIFGSGLSLFNNNNTIINWSSYGEIKTIDLNGVSYSNFTNITSFNSSSPLEIGSSSRNNYFNIININGSYNSININGSNNTLANVIINNSRANAIDLYESPKDTQLINVTISNTNSSKFDIFASEGSNGTTITNPQQIGKYNFSGSGSLIIFNKTNIGEIRFLRPINGSGSNLSSDMQLFNNSAYVNSTSNSWLNKSANITLRGIDTSGFIVPTILKDGVPCGSACYNFTSLTANPVIFNVTSWSNYSIGEGLYSLTTCTNITSSGNYTLQNNVSSTGTCFNIQANNVTIDGNGYWINYSTGGVSGYGVNLTRVNSTTIRNITINEGNGSANSGKNAIQIYFSNNNSIYNVNINVISDSYAIYLDTARGNNLSYLVLNSSALSSNLIRVELLGDYNNLTYSTLRTSGYSAIYLAGSNNLIAHNSISSMNSDSSSTGLEVVSGHYNLIQYNNITTKAVGISALFGPIGNTFSYNLIQTNNTYGDGVYFGAGVINATLDSNTIITNGTNAIGINLDYVEQFINLRNNNITTGYQAISDAVTVAHNASFEYNNSFGIIKWTNSSTGGFLKNVTVSKANLSFGLPYLLISNNSAYLNSTYFAGEKINSSANITLYGINAFGFSNPIILKDGTPCGSACYNFTALTADTVIFNVTSWSNYSIQNSSAPTVSSVDTISAQTPTEGGLKAVTFSFNVTDADGISNINFTSTKANFSYSSETPRTNSSCINTVNYSSVKIAQFSCTVSMFYYDAPADWRVNVSVSDNYGNFAYNDSKNMTYNTLYAFTMSPTNLTWPTIYTTSSNVGASNDPLVLNNTGNANGLAVNITAYNLRGITSPSQFIYADNFTVGAANSCPEGTEPANATEAIISGATLNRGSGATGTEEVYFCIDGIPITNIAQEYTSAAYGEWIIEIISGSILVLIKKIFSLMFGTLALVVAIRPKGKRRENKELTKAVSLVMDVVKRNNSLGDSEAIALLYKIIREEKIEIKDELINSLTALINGVKEEYSLDEESLIEMFVDSLGKRYGLTKKVVKKIGGRTSTHISLSIFSTELGALEALVKYMKENLKMDYSEISEQLGRDYKTIWTAYSKANEKKKTEIEEKKGIQIPLSIFNQKDLTIFESVVLYLNELGMKYSEIGELLNRDQRNMWTICSRAKKKI